MVDPRPTQTAADRRTAPPDVGGPLPVATEPSPPDPPHLHGLGLVSGMFKFNGVATSLVVLRELLRMRHGNPPMSMSTILHVIVTGAAAYGFLQTAKLLRARRREGAVMAAVGIALMMSQGVSGTSINEVPIVIGLVGLAIVASHWKKLD